MTTMRHRLGILIVDRDLRFIVRVQRHLHWQGYEVFSASDRRSAERLLGRMPISVLLTGLESGADNDGEGAELLEVVKRHRPSIKTVLFTGASPPPLTVDQGDPCFDACLSKPIDLEQLRLTILGLLKTA